jgi:NAD dependent epimerase/dehydratase
VSRVLVTGADGFIGSHLVESLVKDGYAVRATIMYNAMGSRGWLDEVPDEILKSVEIVATDIRDSHAVRMAVGGCDAVLNLAALIGIPYSYEAPQSYVETNIQGTLNILVAARDLGVTQVIQTSTSEVYGTAQFVPMTEDHPLQAQSPYAASKIAADQMALSFQRSFGLPVKVIRPFNTYGPRQSARAVIPTIIAQLLADSQLLNLGSLHPTRDLTFVSDTAAGFIAALKAEAAVGQVINLGSGFEISIGDLVKLIASEMGVTPEIRTDGNRTRPEQSEVERLWAEISVARELLGWKPEFLGRDGLRRGISLTIEWFAAQSRGAYRPSEYQR